MNSHTRPCPSPTASAEPVVAAPGRPWAGLASPGSAHGVMCSRPDRALSRAAAPTPQRARGTTWPEARLRPVAFAMPARASRWSGPGARQLWRVGSGARRSCALVPVAPMLRRPRPASHSRSRCKTSPVAARPSASPGRCLRHRWPSRRASSARNHPPPGRSPAATAPGCARRCGCFPPPPLSRHPSALAKPGSPSPSCTPSLRSGAGCDRPANGLRPRHCGRVGNRRDRHGCWPCTPR